MRGQAGAAVPKPVRTEPFPDGDAPGYLPKTSGDVHPLPQSFRFNQDTDEKKLFEEDQEVMSRISRMIGDGLCLEFEMVSAISYALYHSGIPVVSDLKIRNQSAAESAPFRLSFHIPEYSQPWDHDIAAIAPGHTQTLGSVPLDLRHEMLFDVQHCSKEPAELQVSVDGRLLFTEPLEVLGFAEWSFDPALRPTLACFVLPGNPVVQEITINAITNLTRKGSDYTYHQLVSGDSQQRVALVRAIYEAVQKLSIHRDLPPRTFSDTCQRIRTPDEVLAGSPKQRGRGTCLDLVLLMASCLENLHLQPLVIFVNRGPGMQHALLGCWTTLATRAKPVVTDYASIEQALKNGRMVPVETAGLTVGNVLSFDAAVEKATTRLTKDAFVFALDVAAARRTVIPLEFPMNAASLAIVRESEILAQKEKSPAITPKHLLAAMLQRPGGGGVIRKLLKTAGARLTWVEKIRGGEGPAVVPRRTADYRRCLSDAVSMAGGRRLVREEHLLYGLLISDSPEVETMFHRLGTNRSRVLGVLRRALSPAGGDAAETVDAPGKPGYQFPVPAARTIVSDERGRVLIVKRKPKQQCFGAWCLPGGKVDYGETAEEAAARELFEETSLECTAISFLFHQDSPPMEPGGMHCLNLYFKCDCRGTLKLNEEADDFAWIGPEDLPHYHITFRHDTALERYWREHRGAGP